MFFLGIDAGGSKTHALLTDERGRLLGWGHAGNGNHQTASGAARQNIEQACNQAMAMAGITKEEVTFAFFGLAGADREVDYRVLRPLIASLEFANYDFSCDTMIGMRAGTKLPYGAVIISGTGFNCAARNAAGEELQYGGFGFLFGDGQGSGTDLAVHAFRSAIRGWDGRGRPTMLSEMVPQRIGYLSLQEMYDDVLDNKKRPPHLLAQVVFEAAALGDEVAIQILEDAGKEHGNAANALIRRLKMEQERFNVVLIGSVMSKGSSPHMVDAIQHEVNRVAPHASIVRLEVDPVVGAVMSAMDRHGKGVDEETDAALRTITFTSPTEAIQGVI